MITGSLPVCHFGGSAVGDVVEAGSHGSDVEIVDEGRLCRRMVGGSVEEM
jgi:hypothetical protein